jgi:hypothetical protein
MFCYHRLAMQFLVIQLTLLLAIYPYEILIIMQLVVYKNSGEVQSILSSKLKKLAEG